MKANYTQEKLPTGYRFKCTRTNRLGEELTFDITLTTVDAKSRNSLPYLWYREGKIPKKFDNYWVVETYVKTKDGTYGKYNPQHAIKEIYDEKGNKLETRNSQIDFDWMLEGTQANFSKLCDEVEYRFFNETKTVILKEVKRDIKTNYLAEINSLHYIDCAELKYYLVEIANNGKILAVVEGEETPQKAAEAVLQKRGYITHQTFQGKRYNYLTKANNEADLLHDSARIKIKTTLIDKKTGNLTNYKSFYSYNN